MAFEVTYKATQFFLDRAEVQRRLGVARVRALSRQGAFLRRRARTDVLRRRKKVSGPAMPPSVHSRSQVATLRNILFFYDARSETVVVGPVKLNQVNRSSRSGSAISIPSLMEFGGTVTIDEERRIGSQGQWYRRDMRSQRKRSQREYRTRRATYRPRPFMGVALQREIQAGTIVQSWANTVRAA